MAIGLRADVTILDQQRRRACVVSTAQFQGTRIETVVYSNRDAVERHLLAADLVIGGVLVPGATAPKLVSRDHIARMKPGSAIVDVAIDQGGCVETSHATTHEDPTFIVDEVVHYCVANMPGAVARTSTVALNNATLPFIIKLANKGAKQACADNVHLRNGLNVHAGQVTYRPVAEGFNLPYVSAEQALGI
jgi:alanine dehydrogenase